MVPGAGLEPARPLGREILSLLCLPIPPPGHRGQHRVDAVWYCQESIALIDHTDKVEARAGFEPASADLQSAAWPLCYRANIDINP